MLIIASLPEASLPRRCSLLARPALPLQDGGYARGTYKPKPRPQQSNIFVSVEIIGIF
jgi:hypothetical protein